MTTPRTAVPGTAVPGAAVPGTGTGTGTGAALVLFGRLVGPLLAGYLLFDKAFAYLHVPGVPLYVGDLVLGVGMVAALTATGYVLVPLREEPVLAMLAAFVLWGFIRFVPGPGVYGMDALRDAALWLYALYALLVTAAIARTPGLVERLAGGLDRFTPWLLLWLPVGLVLVPFAADAPSVPGTQIPVLTHKTGDAAVAAFLVLVFLWFLPGRRSARRRNAWSLLALVVIALAATQNRGGLIGVVAGTVVALPFLHDGFVVALKGAGVVALGLGLATLLALEVPVQGQQGRSFSAPQLVANVVSLSGDDAGGNLSGTVSGRQVLWTRVYDKQVHDGLLVYGSGFGPNLAKQVGVLDEGTDRTRNPHNSHLDVLARMGLVGLGLWIALWACWYWRTVLGCRRLAARGLHARRRVAVVCLAVVTAILVSAFFDPELEAPQLAVPLWTLFGVGVAVTSLRGRGGGDLRGLS